MFSIRPISIFFLFALAMTLGCATGDLENEGELDGQDAGSLDAEPTAPDTENPPDAYLDTNDSPDTGNDGGQEPDAETDADTGGIDLCPGGCATNETCTDDGCVDLCAEQEYQCGDWTIQGHSVTCGTCPSGTCDDGQCANICDDFLAQCGDIFWSGESIDCGACSGTEHCRNNQCAANSGYVDLTLGNSHTCALRPNRQVRCWGGDDKGQLGDNSQLEPSSSPVSVYSLNTALTIDALNDHTCVTLEDSRVRCWGANGNGRLGDGEVDDAPLPVDASGLTSAVDTSTGSGHSCSLTSAGRARCWGDNGQGQLGTGVTLSNPTFDHQKNDVQTQLGPLEDVIDISLGAAFSCAVQSDNSGWCWGYNNRGQLGLGDNADGKVLATKLANLEPVQSIHAGFNHACALAAGGDIYCWGRGTHGALGHGSSGHSYVPTPVDLPHPAVHVSAGLFHSCAALQNGAVYCWGSNEFGQLGGGTFGGDSNTPQQVAGINNVHIVVAGGHHSCALDRSGDIFCWGRNHVGQLGDGSADDRATPGVVP